MRIEVNPQGVTLVREPGDRALSREGSVTHHIRRLLNERDGASHWRRTWPHKSGLTCCRQGVRSRDGKTVYWHERYALELAHTAFNAGEVFFLASHA